MNKVIHIDSRNTYGNMSSDKKFYPHDMPEEEIKDLFLNRRMAFGKEYDFDGHKMFIASQKDSSNYFKGLSTKIGTYFKLTTEYAKENPNGWTDITEDILVIAASSPEIVAGHPVADCPVIMITDINKGYTAIGHCDAQLIDAKLPMMIADSLVETCASRDEDLITYVSACANIWIYDNYPSWVQDKKLWNDAITPKGKDNFQIDLRKVIKKQLLERNLNPKLTYFCPDDTITNPNYYSNYASSPLGLNVKEKYGCQFMGAFYQTDKEKVKVKKC